MAFQDIKITVTLDGRNDQGLPIDKVSVVANAAEILRSFGLRSFTITDVVICSDGPPSPAYAIEILTNTDSRIAHRVPEFTLRLANSLYLEGARYAIARVKYGHVVVN